MKTCSKVILSCLVLFVQALPGASAQELKTDTLRLKVHFERRSAVVNSGYEDNGTRMGDFVEALRRAGSTPGYSLRSVNICAGASPDGNTRSNQELSEARTRSLQKYYAHLHSTTLSAASLPPADIHAISLGENWEGLAEALRTVREPWVPKALDIVLNTPIWVLDDKGVVVDSRKKQLKELENGIAWGYFDRYLFDEYCSVGTVEVVFTKDKPGAENPSGGRQLEKYFGSLQDSTKTILEIQFRLDSTRVDLDYAGNRERLHAFLDTFEKRYGKLNPATLQMDIYAGASPEGTAEHNFWLGAERGASIRRLLERQLGGRIGAIEVHNEAARWQDLYESIAGSDEPWRDEVLSILSLPPSDNPKALDHRELKLRALRGGTVWPDLLRKYLAPLRSGGSAGAAGKGGSSIVLSFHPERDTIYIKESRRDTVFVIQQMPVCPDSAAVPKARKDRLPADKSPAWAVKTNLLMWGVVAPNVQVEIPLGRWNRWSLEWEYMHPWFIWNNNAQASQILDMGLELRLYLGNRDYHRWLDGWHLGIAVAGGKYDWEWKQHEGWQGEFINAYFNVGYQHRFGKHWAVDAGLGLGVIPSRYRHYYGGSVYPENHLEPWDEHLIWHDTGSFVFPAATHVNVSISYLFNNRPFRLRDMSRKKAQEYNDAYNDHQAHKQALKRQKEELREQKAVAREQKRESKQKKSRKQQ